MVQCGSQINENQMLVSLLHAGKLEIPSTEHMRRKMTQVNVAWISLEIIVKTD